MASDSIQLAVDSAKQLFEAGDLALGPRLMTLMEGGTVERWHVERVPGQSVAAHSHGVAVILLHIYPDCTLTLLKAALFHDLAEKLSGDLPAPVKWDYPEMDKFLDSLSAKVEKSLGIHIVLWDNEKTILKIADYLDAMFYCYEQRKRGNQYADAIFNRLCWFFEKTDWKFSPRGKEVWTWLKTEYKNL